MPETSEDYERQVIIELSLPLNAVLESFLYITIGFPAAEE